MRKIICHFIISFAAFLSYSAVAKKVYNYRPLGDSVELGSKTRCEVTGYPKQEQGYELLGAFQLDEKKQWHIDFYNADESRTFRDLKPNNTGIYDNIYKKLGSIVDFEGETVAIDSLHFSGRTFALKNGKSPIEYTWILLGSACLELAAYNKPYSTAIANAMITMALNQKTLQLPTEIISSEILLKP